MFIEAKKDCCGTCRYGSYDSMQGYVCVNDASEYWADYTEHDFVCDEYEEKRTNGNCRKADK